MAGNRPTARDRRSIDVETRSTGGGDGAARLPAAGTGSRGVDCDQNDEQAEGPSRHERGTATRNVEEASSMERAAGASEERDV